MYGKKVWGIERTTFVIGPDQTLLHVFHKVTPEGHAEQVLSMIKEWNKADVYARTGNRDASPPPSAPPSSSAADPPEARGWRNQDKRAGQVTPPLAGA